MTNNKAMDVTFIDVSGFFSSGSSAAVDLLKEFSNTYECVAEIRLIKDPYGIRQLEEALTNHWELINSTAAINDFLNFCKILSRGGRFPLAPAGLQYSKKITHDFLDITNEYISKLTKFRYKSDFYYQKFKKNYFIYVIDRWRWAIEYLSKGVLKTANRKMKSSYFSNPSHEEFNIATQEYFEKLFSNYIKTEKKNYIILDQAVSPNDTQVIHRYFKKAKMIIVDRDPRDMFIDDVLWGANLDSDRKSAEAGKRYAERQKALRHNMILDEDVLYIHFEDLILKYDEIVPKIAKFVGFSIEDHVEKGKYLNPEFSKKNIGIWKKYYSEYKEPLDVLEKELDYLCYKE